MNMNSIKRHILEFRVVVGKVGLVCFPLSVADQSQTPWAALHRPFSTTTGQSLL